MVGTGVESVARTGVGWQGRCVGRGIELRCAVSPDRPSLIPYPRPPIFSPSAPTLDPFTHLLLHLQALTLATHVLLAVLLDLVLDAAHLQRVRAVTSSLSPTLTSRNRPPHGGADSKH